MPNIDVNNTEIAFESKSNAELRQMYWLFRMFNNPTLVSVGSKLTLWALDCRLPVEWAIKKTIFRQFCGGDTLENAQKTIDHLGRYNTLTVLDYGAEAKSGEAEFDKTEREMLRVVEFAGKNPTVPVISCKVTGLARFELLEKLDRKETLDEAEQAEWARAAARLDRICQRAAQLRVGVFIDAEETWIQDTVDALTEFMMSQYNRERVTVYNTIQLYRHDRLAFLKVSHETARAKGYLLGAKLVRGAYMEKERARAAEMGYPSPIQPDKASTDRDYDEAVRYCVAHYREIGSCVASHNVQSNLLQAELMEKAGIPANDSHLNFSQLYGMSDNLTFNLAKAGYNVAKYVPYGPVRDVMPYLIRRAQENSSVSGDMSRELRFIVSELQRRKK
jgi:proline dehydrogenase